MATSAAVGGAPDRLGGTRALRSPFRRPFQYRTHTAPAPGACPVLSQSAQRSDPPGIISLCTKFRWSFRSAAQSRPAGNMSSRDDDDAPMCSLCLGVLLDPVASGSRTRRSSPPLPPAACIAAGAISGRDHSILPRPTQAAAATRCAWTARGASGSGRQAAMQPTKASDARCAATRSPPAPASWVGGPSCPKGPKVPAARRSQLPQPMGMASGWTERAERI